MMSISRIVLGLGRRELLNWISDESYIKFVYKLRQHKRLNLDDPRSFNEKMQWLKLNCRAPKMTMLADKKEVKEYISAFLGKEYIIPTLGIWDDANDIDFDKLPDRFVLKCNHDSGSVLICRDKSEFDIVSAIEQLNKKLRHSGYWYGREWPYKNIEPCIIAEDYIDSEDERGLMDYKFFCFNGEPRFLYVSVGLEHHPTARISFYDLDGNEMPFHRSDYVSLGKPLELPENYYEMKMIAAKIAKDIDLPFVRVDLYSVRNAVYFSEITFYPCNGIIPFEPEEWDLRLGDLLLLR